MAERISALDGHYSPGQQGDSEDTGVILREVRDLILQQVAVWADTVPEVGGQLAQQLGLSAAPGPGQSATGANGSILRIDPLRWWTIGVEAPELDPRQGTTLDLSHSRTRVRVSGPNQRDFLNRLLPLDLREQKFPVGSVASSVIDHVGVTLWHSDLGYEVFIPRGYALFVWQGMVESAKQFGVRIG